MENLTRKPVCLKRLIEYGFGFLIFAPGGTEIDSICGVVGRLGQAHGVATPIHDALSILIRVAESRTGKTARS